MDSRYIQRDDDGLPVIADRDRLPLLWLLEGAGATSKFTKRAIASMHNSTSRAGITALNIERDAVAYELTLPSWWHFCPVRTHKTGDKPRPLSQRTKPLYIWLRR